MSLTEQLAAHDERVTVTKQRVREVDLEVRAAVATVSEAKDQVIEAHAEGDDAKAAKLGKALATAEDNARRLRDEKQAGVTRALTRAEADRQLFATENFAGLIAERRPDAEAVASGFEEAMGALHTRHAEWLSMEQQTMALCRLAGRQTGHIPRFPERLANLMRDASRAGGLNVPVPLPGDAQQGPQPHAPSLSRTEIAETNLPTSTT